jgi:hypothetical protein
VCFGSTGETEGDVSLVKNASLQVDIISSSLAKDQNERKWAYVLLVVG